MEIQNILDAYRNGDEDVRLHLFLQHRDLREEFMALEQATVKTPETAAGKAKQDAAHGRGMGFWPVRTCLKALHALF